METPSPEIIASLSLLRGADPASLQDITARFERCRLPPGEVLLRPGQLNDRLFALVSGRIEVHLTSMDDGPVIELQPGECVGEISLLDGHPASALVVTAADTEVLVIDQRTLWALVERSGEVARNLLHMLSQRLRNNNALVDAAWHQRRDFEDQAQRDALTGLLNRRGLQDGLERMVQRCAGEGLPLTLLVIDVDHFKLFNDRYGHAAGDRVLAAIARSLAASLRPSDLAARYGGDELVVGLLNANADQGRAVADRIRRGVGQLRLSTAEGGALPAPTLSIGVAELSAGLDSQQLFKAADEAVYRAKEEGRNRVASA